MYLILRIYECEKLYTKKENFGIYFSIVHNSLNFALRNVKFLVTVDDILLEGMMSQNFDSCLIFVFCVKKKKKATFQLFFAYFFSKFHRKKNYQL